MFTSLLLAWSTVHLTVDRAGNSAYLLTSRDAISINRTQVFCDEV